jgi:hypothetical protein
LIPFRKRDVFMLLVIELGELGKDPDIYRINPSWYIITLPAVIRWAWPVTFASRENGLATKPPGEFPPSY